MRLQLSEFEAGGLSRALRTASARHLRGRRRVLALSLVASASMD
jgi:hypothetical protein